MSETFEDELDGYWIRSMKDDREFVAAYAEAEARAKREVARTCPFGVCVTLIDPLDNKITGGYGAVGCGCDNLPGWRSSYYEGLPKPGWPGKPVGRHGGKIAASRRKHAEHQRWLNELANL